MFIKPVEKIVKKLSIPGDKSISHRAVLLASIAEGESIITNFLTGDDCLKTIECLRQMGVDIKLEGETARVNGVGLDGLLKPKTILDVGNSGTTIRLLSGILSGQEYTSKITGDNSIQNRPMERIISPLSKMGAEIKGLKKSNFPPLKIKGGKLKGINYPMPIASAQVKSAILLAGLYAKDKTTVIEKEKSRDHTERMLKFMGAKIKTEGKVISLAPSEKLQGKEFYIPGDLSSAAFFLVLGMLGTENQILIKNVGLNPTRTGIIDVLEKMGGNLKIMNKRSLNGEPVGDLLVTSSELKGVEIGGELIPRLIDEIPVLAVAAAFAEGETVIKDAEELRVKETDRIKVLVKELSQLGVEIKERKDGMVILGKGFLTGGEVDSHGDHRMAMAFAIAGLASKEGVKLNNSKWAQISFPGFFELLKEIKKESI